MSKVLKYTRGGVTGATEGTIRVGEGTIRAGQDFKYRFIP